MEDIDTQTGGDELSIDEAAAAYAKATTEAADTGQADVEETAEADTTDDELQASDEDVSEEDDGETADEKGQAEDEDDEEPESEKGRYVAHNGRVKLPDGTESTIADLIQGNLRDRDYRQKTMETAELRKSFESQSSSLKERETQLEQQATYVTDLIKSIIPARPGPDLLRTDPYAYNLQLADHEQWLQHLAYLDGQRQQTEKERAAEAEKEQATRADREWNALVEKVPAFKDKAKFTAFANDVNKFGADYGFTPQELRGLAFDHRQIVVMRKAIQWDKLQASKAGVQKKVENRPPVQKGGKRLNPAEHNSRRATDALSNLKSSGRLDDAVAAYLATQPKG